jgi:hypothetical protein
MIGSMNGLIGTKLKSRANHFQTRVRKPKSFSSRANLAMERWSTSTGLEI